MKPRAESGARAMRGATFVELMFALAIVGITAMVQIQQVIVTLRDYHQDLDAEFANRKATGILAEIQATVDQGNIVAVEGLDALRDPTPSALLTTRFADAPDHFMSGNLRDAAGQWQWLRSIDVEQVPGADRSRYVTVRVMRNNGSGPPSVLGVAAGIFSLSVRAEPYVQEFDVYVLAIAEAPSLWQPLPALRAQVQSLADEITGANPNVRFKLHWITKLGYGRDPLYVPFVNRDQDAAAAAPWVYWYPGKLAPGSPFSTLYVPEAFGGRVRTETGVLQDYHADDNPYPHAVADRNNHCMRTPEARDLFALRVAAGIDKVDEPPLQLLLADMAQAPQRYRNALFVNLHGDGLPFPPLRNYADPAKEPLARPGLRVVTHPARLHTLANPTGPSVDFRVYAYETTPPIIGPGVVDTITVQIMGGDFRSGLVVDRQTGGIDVITGMVQSLALDGGYAISLAPKHSDPHAPFEMCYEVGYATTPQPHTWVRLYNTPKTCPADFWGHGLHADARLYGTDYVPSPVAWNDSFFALINGSGPHVPKNTCRWRLRLDQATLAAQFGSSAMLTAVTRIGTDTTTGRVWPTPHQPSNISTTYAWWSADRHDVPLTERYQFLGDPRHNPYLDLCADGASFPHGYNWWFDDLRSATIDAANPWTCFDRHRLADGFGGKCRDDAPRMLQVWREALQACGGVFVNPHGQLAARMLLGGELLLPAVDSTLEPAPLTLHGQITGNPLTMVSASGLRWFSSAPGRHFVRKHLFFAKPWLGELCDDVDFAAYLSCGNAATSNGYAVTSSSMWHPPGLPWGTLWDRDVTNQLGDLGCAGFAQGTATANLWQTGAAQVDYELAPTSRDFLQKFGVAMPTTAPSRWQLAIDGGTAVSPLASYPDQFPPQDLGELLSLAASGRGGSVMRIADDTRGAALLVALCDRPLDAAQHRALAIKTLGLGVRALIEGSATGLPDALEPLPQLQISEPSPQQVLVNPTSVTLRWDVAPRWFEGQPHARAYAESALRYLVTYQRLGDTQWRHISDSSVVTPTNRLAPEHLLGDSGPGAESLILATSGAHVPAGEYFVRIECLRGDSDAHMTRHEVRVVVKR